MARLSWNVYSKRRKAKLTSFLRGVKTVKEAVDKFSRLKIAPPMDLIFEHYGLKQTSSDTTLAAQRAPEASVKNDTKSEVQKIHPEAIVEKTATDQDDTQEKYDDLIVIQEE